MNELNVCAFFSSSNCDSFAQHIPRNNNKKVKSFIFHIFVPVFITSLHLITITENS